MVGRILAGVGVAAVFALGVPATASAQAKPAQGKTEMKAPAGHQATVTGTVIDVSCKFSHGLAGAMHRECAQVCADKGIPLAILGSDGKLYLPTSEGMPGDGQNARLREFAEQTVTVSGKVFQAGGASAIQIASIQKKS